MSYQGISFYIGPRMTLNGMVVHLDTANPKSYSGTGNVVTDISVEGLQRNATFIGGHSITSEGIYFDGLTGKGSISQPSITYDNGIDVLQQWTIGFFIKTDNDAGWIISPASRGADHYFRYLTSNGGRIQFEVTQFTDVGNRRVISTFGTVPPDNKWTYVTCTLTGIEMKIYINGVLNVTRTNDLPVANWTSGWQIGARAFNLGQYFRGILQNIHIYNRELSPAEILQNFYALKGRYPNLRYVEQEI